MSYKDYHFIIVVIDYLTKFVKVQIVKMFTNEKVVQFTYERIVTTFRVPLLRYFLIVHPNLCMMW
jgi:hypothetical protein